MFFCVTAGGGRAGDWQSSSDCSTTTTTRNFTNSSKSVGCHMKVLAAEQELGILEVGLILGPLMCHKMVDLNKFRRIFFQYFQLPSQFAPTGGTTFPKTRKSFPPTNPQVLPLITMYLGGLQ